VGDIDLKMISAAKNSNKFQKTRFWKEKSVEDVVTLRPIAQATLCIRLCYTFTKLFQTKVLYVVPMSNNINNFN
jgi:hypothetical protein